jgi:hypothetical protein
MRIIRSVTSAAAALAIAVISSAAAPPVAAGRLCDKAGLSSPCVQNGDLKARVDLGKFGKDGRLQVKNADNETAVKLDSITSNVTNRFENNSATSNGLVKAWARINPDGTIDACWRCNTDPNETRLFGPGLYEVDFTPLSTDIRGRPRAVTLDGSNVVPSFVVIRSFDDEADPSSVPVLVHQASTGATTTTAFTLFIY